MNGLDFLDVTSTVNKQGKYEIAAEYFNRRSKDLMVRGGGFYALWDQERLQWITDEYEIVDIIDARLKLAEEEQRRLQPGASYVIKYLSRHSTGAYENWLRYTKNLRENFHDLDSSLVFADTEPRRENYSTKALPYSMYDGSIECYDEMMSTLYDKHERDKLEWAIGSIITGDSKKIQKFIVLAGAAGTGKSTFLNIVQMLFEGYYGIFDAKELASASNAFAMEGFKDNPLVAIQHDGDLSRIADNTKINSLVSHEDMPVNMKYKDVFYIKPISFLFMGTNKPVQITDSKSGLIRRLIDVNPSGRKVPPNRYEILMDKIRFELGAIAHYCRDKYLSMGKHYYDNYQPKSMMYQTDMFFNFVDEHSPGYASAPFVQLSTAWKQWNEFKEEAQVEMKMSKAAFSNQLADYFEVFYKEGYRYEGKQYRSVFVGFKAEKFDVFKGINKPDKESPRISLTLDQTESLLDEMLKDCQAQEASGEKEVPGKAWDDVETTLKDIDTKKVHYVRPPLNHIVIDFDLKDENGNKSQELNLLAASKWQPTYAEFSKSGGGVHLHYLYRGDVESLSRIYDQDIEIKIFSGKASLRRRLSLCNNIPVATLTTLLRKKETRGMINNKVIENEKHLRSMIIKNLKKEIHPGTKPSCDFIHKLLEDAYNSGMNYDVTDMYEPIMSFAMSSSHQSDYCMALVIRMKFKSEEKSDNVKDEDDRPITFFDVEVFPNLFLIVYKERGNPKKHTLINPEPYLIEDLMSKKLVGFNNVNYDNYMLYAASLGYSAEALYNLSKRIINNDPNIGMYEAKNISHTDIYDFASAQHKKSLKKWEIELGIHHMELGFDWDQPVPPDKWDKVGEYCGNDVDATEAVFEHIYSDYIARCILAELSGLTPNDSTNSHSKKFIFGDNKNPQNEFNMVDLSEMFPGYKYEEGIRVVEKKDGSKVEVKTKVSTYKGYDVGEGGFVWANPGMYVDVALIDVASMHPSSLIAMNMFGDTYTKRFQDVKDARVAIKHGDLDAARHMLDGALEPFLRDESKLQGLPDALKTVINSVYGLTAANFPNPFRHKDNIDNKVAKRGALFMVDLLEAVQNEGYTVVHIKTDSIKIANADDYIINFCLDFAKKYDYEFEHEATYSKICLVNDAVYLAQYKGGKKDGKWTATGAQFADPYVADKLYLHPDSVDIVSYQVAKSVAKGAIYMKDVEKEDSKPIFVGRVSSFLPVAEGGQQLLRVDNGKESAVTGTKGYLWMETSVWKQLQSEGREIPIDWSYYDHLYTVAYDTIAKYGDPEWFLA